MAGCRGASSAGLIVLVTFVWAASAWAEPQEPSRDLTEMSLEALMTLQVASVYGASKYLQKETDAPGFVTIVTAEEIQRYGYRTLADILRSVPGLTVTSDRNYTYLGVRGFGRPGDYNTRVLLLVDGHRLNDNIYDNAPLGTDFPLDVDLIDRVEVIQGPSSSLYGTNAFFAVVSVITKRAPQVANGELSGSVGSYDSYKARGTYGATLANGLEVMLSTSAYSSRGHRSLFYPEFDDPATNNGIARKADDDRALQLYGLASFHGFTLQGLVGAREKRIPTASFGTVFDDARNRTTDTRGYLDLRYEDTLPYEIGLLARLYYDRVEYYGHYIYAAESAGEAPIENRDLGHGEWVGSEVQLSRVLWDRHKVITGVEYQRNLSQNQKNYDRSPYLLNLDDRRSGSLWAVYGQGEFFLLKNLVLNAGLRYDYYYTFGGTTSPRVALIYHPVAGSTLKLLYGEAFRAPNAYELYYSAAGNQANPGLQPETIRTTQVVIEQELGRHLRLTTAGFYSWIDDLINQETDPADGAIVYRNVQSVTARGVAVVLDGRLPGGIAGRASYTFQDVRDSGTGRVLSNSPQHLGKLNVIAPLFRDWLFLGGELQYTSARRTVRGGEAEAFWVANVTLFTQKLLSGVSFSASVYNLFDQQYGDPGAEEHRQDVIGQDGRTFQLKLTYRF